MPAGFIESVRFRPAPRNLLNAASARGREFEPVGHGGLSPILLVFYMGRSRYLQNGGVWIET